MPLFKKVVLISTGHSSECLLISAIVPIACMLLNVNVQNMCMLRNAICLKYLYANKYHYSKWLCDNNCMIVQNVLCEHKCQ